MIKSVHLKNFQSHKDSVFEFPNGITSLTGSSNSGKTAILRAIGWVFNNRPSGEAMVSDFVRDNKGKQKEECSVKIIFDDNTIVERVRSKTENVYRLNGKTLEAIGLTVPDEITKACNVSEVNFQSQMEAPFLLSESSGEVARFFNKIVKLDSIDVYLSAIESKKRKTKAEKEVVKDNLERVNKELQEYTWLEEAEKLINKLDKLNEKEEKVNDTLNNILQAISIVQRMQSIMQQTVIIDEAERLTQEYDTLSTEIVKLKHDIIYWEEITETYCKFLDTIKSFPDFDLAEKLCTKCIKLTTMVKDNEKIISALNESIEKYNDNKRVLDSFQKEYDALMSMLPETCPLCGGEVSTN